MNSTTTQPTLRRLVGESGVTALEYALIAGLIAVAVAVGVRATGAKVHESYDNLGTNVAANTPR